MSAHNIARTAALFMAAAVACAAIAGDDPRRSRSADDRPIPAKAIKVPLPDVAQPDDYSCAAAAMASIGNYYGVGPQDVEGFKKKLHTDPDEGTYYKNIAQYARYLKLSAEVRQGMTIRELERFLAAGKPVICSIQAYADNPQVYADPDNNENGHYVVAIGFDAEVIYFMDPSIDRRRRGYLPKDEFLQRWHENEGSTEKPELSHQLGIVISPKGSHAPFLLRAAKIE
jgi:predicted double-glycine peptidase